MKVFNETVRGYLHISKERPCEDSSLADKVELFDGSYAYVAAVSDGHGDRKCFRSEIGSKLAVQIAIERLTAFAKRISQENSRNEFFEASHSKQQILKNLSDSILASWSDQVNEDLILHPIKDEERCNTECWSDEYERGENLQHIYGATLIASLWMDSWLIAIQQGDGRFITLDADGNCSEPLPWDEKCIGNVTTSLCDADAVDRIRSIAINIDAEHIIGCFLCSDGVEDSFRTNEGAYHYLKLFASDTSSENADREEVRHKLSSLSEAGSGDDISIAGVFDESIVSEFKSIFDVQNEIYELSEAVYLRNEKLSSMERKHNYLYSHRNEHEHAAEFELYHEDYKSIENEIKELQLRIEKLRETDTST